MPVSRLVVAGTEAAYRRLAWSLPDDAVPLLAPPPVAGEALRRMFAGIALAPATDAIPGAAVPSSGAPEDPAGPSPLVLAIGPAGAGAAEVHVRRAPARLVRLPEADSLRRLDADAVAGASSVTLIGLSDAFAPRVVRLLQAGLGDADIPWGILPGRTPAELAWVVAKQHLSRGRTPPDHLLLNPMGPAVPDGADVPGVLWACGEGVTAELLGSLTTVPRGLVAVLSHGDQADAYLFSGWLCSRPADAAPAPGRPVMRCWAERGCYRAAADPARRSDRLVPVREVSASVLFLDICHSLLIAPGQRYDPASALLPAALEGLTTAVVATETMRRPDPDEADLLSSLLRSGAPLGEAVAELNRLQERRFSGDPGLVLVGDPRLRLAAPAAADTGPQFDGRRGSTSLSRSRSSGPAGGPPPLDIARLRGIQRSMRHLTVLTCPAPPETREALAAAVVTALRAAHRPAEKELTATMRVLASNDVRDRLAALQAAAVGGWTRAWSDALTGEMLSLREDLVAYEPTRRLAQTCGRCGAPLSALTAHALADPDVVRRLRVCPNCTVVADTAAGIAPPTLRFGTAELIPGVPWEVCVGGGDAGQVAVRTTGAAIVGARGCARPAVAVARGTTADREVRLRLTAEPGFVPGVYSLRVVDVADADCRFALTQVLVRSG